VEFADAKEFIKGSFVLSLDSNAEIASFLINMQLHALGIDYLEKRNQLVEAVTREQVAAMAKRLIIPDNLLVISVGKKP
jgi:zinc protease